MFRPIKQNKKLLDNPEQSPTLFKEDNKIQTFNSTFTMFVIQLKKNTTRLSKEHEHFTQPGERSVNKIPN